MSQQNTNDEVADCLPTTEWGASLQAARTKQHKSIDYMANQLKISKQVVISLEKSQLPDRCPLLFVRGYLRQYAKLVDLDIEPLVQSFNKQYGKPTSAKVKAIGTHSQKMFFVPSFVSTVLVIVLVLLLGHYVVHKLNRGTVHQQLEKATTVAQNAVSLEFQNADNLDELLPSASQSSTEPAHTEPDSTEAVPSKKQQNHSQVLP